MYFWTAPFCKFENYQFQVIGSLSDTLRSVSLETGSEIPLYDIEIGSHNGAITENSTCAGPIANKEIDESTPLASNSLNLISTNGNGRNTDILMQNVSKSSLVDGTSLSIHPCHGNFAEKLNYSLKSKIDAFLYCHNYDLHLANWMQHSGKVVYDPFEKK